MFTLWINYAGLPWYTKDHVFMARVAHLTANLKSTDYIAHLLENPIYIKLK